MGPRWKQQKGFQGQGQSVCRYVKAHRHWLGTEAGSLQSLYKDTVEALDQMLQNFIMQNPTPEELHFLLSVRLGTAGPEGLRRDTRGRGNRRTQGSGSGVPQ